MAVAEVRFSIGSNLQLATAFRCHRINPRRNQPIPMLALLVCVNDMNRLVAALESILNKGKQYAIFFFIAVEECTNVTGFCEL